MTGGVLGASSRLRRLWTDRCRDESADEFATGQFHETGRVLLVRRHDGEPVAVASRDKCGIGQGAAAGPRKKPSSAALKRFRRSYCTQWPPEAEDQMPLGDRRGSVDDADQTRSLSNVSRR